MEVRGRRTEDGDQRSEDREKMGDGRPLRLDEGRKGERTEGGDQRSEVCRPSS